MFRLVTRVDGARAVLTPSPRLRSQGAVATLDKKASAALHAKAGVAKKAPKEKLSRAEKKVRVGVR